MKRLFLMFALLLPVTAPAVAEHFYVNAMAGNDGSSGTTPGRSWRTLAKVDSVVFKPGDVVSFHAGQSWSGLLAPRGSGTAQLPISFRPYGQGARPKIVADGKADQVLLLANVEYVQVLGLELTSDSNGVREAQRGVDVVLDGFGVAHGTVLRDLYVHGIRGSLEHKNTGGIVIRTLKGTKPSRFDGLQIERNIIAHVDRSGIAFESTFVNRNQWFPSTHVSIRENYLEDIGGDAIVPWASSHAVVEWNVVRHAAMRSNDYNAGIWPWSSDDTEVRWNDVSGTGTTKDGEGYDSDYNSRNTIFEFNYSHNNRGGMMLICNPGDFDPAASSGNSGTRVFHNLSYEDKGRIVNISGGVDILIQGNLVLKHDSAETQLIIFSKWNGWARNVQITGNRFLVDGTVTSGHEVTRNEDGTYLIAPGWGGATGVIIDSNSYSSGASVIPLDEHFSRLPSSMLGPFDWDGPVFDLNSGERLTRFVELHRKWLLGLLEKTGVDHTARKVVRAAERTRLGPPLRVRIVGGEKSY